jgi:hypothetical protein
MGKALPKRYNDKDLTYGGRNAVKRQKNCFVC